MSILVEPAFYEEHEVTSEDLKAILKDFEHEYGMTSEEFYEKWKKGEAYWVAESVAWSDLFELYKSLNGKNATILQK